MKNHYFKNLLLVISMSLLSTFVLAADAEAVDEVFNGSAINTFVGKTKIIRLSSPVSRVAVGDADIADFKVVSPSEVYLLGKAVGTTSLILWQKNGKTTSIDATVGIDLAPLVKTLSTQLPNEKDLLVTSASGSVVLGICILAANDGQATNMLLMGTIRSAAFPASIALGAPVYVSTTAGDITATQPTGTDDVIRVVGWTITAEPNTTGATE
jgi:Flp pilus assembly secretin CpaC